MGRIQHHSREFKDAIITKLMNRGDVTFVEVCEKEGVSLSTAYSWLKRDNVSGMKNNNRLKKWSAKEKLQAVSETFSASETEMGLYLRKEGLHSQQLTDWRKQALTSLAPVSRHSSVKDKRDERIKELEREVLRKDKALAEASALLILQKKVNLIWGDEAQK
jgi:transposase-like protein